jgi:hypothetical protein
MLSSEQIDLVLSKVDIKRKKGQLRLVALRCAILGAKGAQVERALFSLPCFGKGSWRGLLDMLDIEQPPSRLSSRVL